MGGSKEFLIIVIGNPTGGSKGLSFEVIDFLWEDSFCVLDC